jgi:uncharacterized protein YlxW (UPF0749 family)
MNNIKKIEIILIPILGIVLGISVSSLIYLNDLVGKLDPKESTEYMETLINQTLSTNNDLQKQIDILQEEHNQLTELTVGPIEKEKLDTLKNELSLNEMKGSGVILTIQEAASPYGFDNTSQCLASHLRDINNVLTLPELKVDGLSINGNRLSFRSTINCIGSGVSVDFQRIVSPFTIDIIGDKTKIKNVLNTRRYLPLLWNDIDNNLINIRIVESDNILLNPFSGRSRSQFIIENITE